MMRNFITNLLLLLSSCAVQDTAPDAGSSTVEQPTFSCPFFCQDNHDCDIQCGPLYTCDLRHGGTNMHPCNLTKTP